MKSPLIIHKAEPLEQAVVALKEGLVVAYPTETLYGLAVDPFNEDAVSSLYELKGREFTEPIPLIIGEIEMLDPLVSEIPEAGRWLMERYWPGPLTIIFKASDRLPNILTAGRGTIAIRLSSSATACALSVKSGGPITATSANPSGQKAPVEALEVIDYFKEKIPVIIDGGRLSGKLGSTIVNVTGPEVTILRQGDLQIQLP